jgi:hypothetical protein
MAAPWKMGLEKNPEFGMFPGLPNDPKRDRKPESETGGLPDPNQDRPLEAASHDIRGILLADGALDGDEDRLDLLGGQLEIIAIDARQRGY